MVNLFYIPTEENFFGNGSKEFKRSGSEFILDLGAGQMDFDKDKLDIYKELLLTTKLQQGYQEFIKLFRYLRVELEKDLHEFSFSGSIVENRMDFAYFQLLSDELKEKGLKVQVVFAHKEFQFEVWVSGYNRKIQCDYYNYLKNTNIEYTINDNPNRVD